MWSSFKSHIGFGGDSDDEDLANAEIDEELKAAMDIPLYNDEAKYFLADYHQIRSLPFKNVRSFTVNLDLSPKERWAEVIEAHKEVMPRVKSYLEVGAVDSTLQKKILSR